MKVEEMTNEQLRYAEWRGSMLRLFRDRGYDMTKFSKDWLERLTLSEMADKELTRRGDGERFT